MKIIMNKKMLDVIVASKHTKSYFPKRLKRILDEGVDEYEECLFLEYFHKNNMHLTINDFQDKTQYEHLINGFYINDYCRSNPISSALLFSYRLYEMITQKYHHKQFLIVVSCEKEDVHISFTTFHQNEAAWIDYNDVDDYKQAVMILR